MPENMKLGVQALPCICCGKALQPAYGTEEIHTNQPTDGLCFVTSGHYGSTVFDLCPGYLEISVCDDCVRAKTKEGFVAHIVKQRQTTEIVSVLPFDPEFEKEV